MIDYVARLDGINKAIAAIEGGAQECRIGTRSVRRADLVALYAERRRIEGMLESAQYGTTLANFSRRW